MNTGGARLIVLHGPESTGKSTLARRLAAHYAAPMVPEYGRLHSIVHGGAFGPSDLVHIMHGHMALTRGAMTAARRRGARYVIADTDPLMTAAWSMMSLGRRDPALDAFTMTGDRYLLLDDDIPWVDDGIRLHRSEAERRKFMALSRAELQRRGIAYALIGGDADARFSAAVAAIEA